MGSDYTCGSYSAAETNPFANAYFSNYAMNMRTGGVDAVWKNVQIDAGESFDFFTDMRGGFPTAETFSQGSTVTALNFTFLYFIDENSYSSAYNDLFGPTNATCDEISVVEHDSQYTIAANPRHFVTHLPFLHNLVQAEL